MAPNFSLDIEKSEADTRRFKVKRLWKTSSILLVFTLILLSTRITLSLIPFNTFYPSQDDYLYRISKDRGIDINPLKRGPSLDPSPNHLHKSMYGAVSSDIELCSQLGVDILKKGGFAADAAVTVALCVGVINSFSSGIGGGGYIVSKQYDKQAISIDAREMAPLAGHKDMFKGHEHLSQVGGLAAAIPGELKGLYTLYKHEGSGKLTWAELIEPVIDVAENGWNASVVLAAAIEIDKKFFRENYSLWDFVFKEGSKHDVVKAGDLIKRPKIGETLRLIANNGSDAVFYDPDGPIAGNLIQAANANGGVFSKADFENYEVELSPALKTEYLGNDVYTCAGSCSGAALISGLNIMDHFGTLEGGDMDPLATHRLVEAMKWVASARSRLGDSTNNETTHITSQNWSDYALRHIKDNQTLANWSDYKPAYELNNPHGTTHFSIVDGHHNAVSMTSTVNLLFGCLVIDPVTGIILNNEMDDFSVPGVPNAFGIEPSIYNFIRPRKRPLSSSSPTIVVNELLKPDLVIGAAGGSRIVTSVLQAIVRIYSYSMPLLEAIAYPRFHHQLLPNHIEHEEHIGSDILSSLQEKGHETFLQPPKTVINAIRRWAGDYHAVSDYWRKRGESCVV